MKCANCAFDNAADSKFCENCGNPLERACPNCGKPVLANAKFCRNCGYALTGSTAVQTNRLAHLQQAAPAALQEKILSTRKQIAGERKLVTVLFADIVGSTEIAEKLDPEEWGEIVSGAHQIVSDAIYRYEGTIAQLLGDGVLAFFGAPITHEDDPERAVNAALDIIAAIHTYAHALRDQKQIPHFRMRVGLNSGLVVVGNIGSDMHVEYLAIGDTVNLAARMQSAAEPNSTLITENTARMVRHAFDLESRGTLELKGKREPVPAFRVIARKAVTESARGIAGLDSPLVGREREFQTLQSHLAALAHGGGHIVAVMGEAGLGKSRLMAEVRKTATVAWLEGRSHSYENSTPYAPFIDVLTKAFDLRVEENDADKYAKIKTHAGDGAPFLATLLGIQIDGDDRERVQYLEPPQLRGAIFQAVRAFIEQRTIAAPLVLLFDDLHWADATSLDLLEQLMPLAETKSLVLVALFRPQRQEPSWRFHETALRDYAHCYTPLTLEPLNDNDSRALVANLLHIEDLPEQVRALILKKAEGNPFFVEEVIRSLLDSKLVVRQDDHWRATREIENIAIPDTLVGVIGARLDRLDDESKRTAQTASVIGREFQRDILTNIFDAPNTLEGSLLTLQRREIVREKSLAPAIVYLFKHALTQEAAYSSILLSKRRDLHKRVAECLERIDPERVYDIARHFIQAEENARALPYLIDAGGRALREYSTQEALGYFSRAVEIAQTSSNPALARRAFEGLGNALTLTGEMPRTLQNYQTMLEFAQTHDDAPMQVSALNKLALMQMMTGNFANVESNLQRAEQIARAANDRAGLAEMFTVRCGICTGTGDFDGAIKYLGESVELGRELNVKEQMAFGMTHTANTLMFLTKFDDAWQKAQEAMQICEEIGDRQHQAELFAGVFTFVHITRGQFDTAREYGEQGIAIGARIGSAMALADGNWMLGTIARLRGEYEKAIAHFEQGLTAAKMSFPGMDTLPLGSIGTTLLEISPSFADKAIELHSQVLQMSDNPMVASMSATAWADIGLCALSVGNLARANEMFQKGLNYPTTMGLIVKPNNLLGAAYVALAQEKFDEAMKFVDDARAYADERKMKHQFPEIALAQARIYAARGDHARALEQFNRAEQLALELKMRPIVWQARAGAAQALDALDRKDEANTKRREAKAMIDEIAELFRDENLRKLFLENATRRIIDSR
jgi:class 3 adenylate cyclase/tetratricopeptide (TPR) repeat protein